MSKSKLLNACIFIIQCVVRAVMGLLFSIPIIAHVLFGLLILIVAGGVFLFFGYVWHSLFWETFGFWPAIIADIFLACFLILKLRADIENDKYKAALIAKETRGEPLEPWEKEAIHPKPSGGLSFSSIIVGLVLGKLFFGRNSGD